MNPARGREAPVIETRRLLLRGVQTDDFADSLSMWSDPTVARFIGGKPSTAEEVWSRILRYAGIWSLMGIGYWVVREKDSGRFVGEAGLADFRRDMTPSLDGRPEAGWALASWAHGKGFATEAVQAVLSWADAHPALRRTVCMIDPANAASLRVAQKCGYTEFARATYKGSPSILFQRG
jgi:RimJ/RimL family protein N-acetyltransferase